MAIGCLYLVFALFAILSAVLALLIIHLRLDATFGICLLVADMGAVILFKVFDEILREVAEVQNDDTEDRSGDPRN